MYTILANVVFAIHMIVFLFLISGVFLPKKWKRIKIFHAYFAILTLIVQIMYGFKCPLTILEDHLRQLQNPNYTIGTPFTEKIFMKLFGISISGNIIFIVIVLLAVLGIAHLLTIKTMKKGDD